MWVGGTQGGYFPTSWSSSLLIVLAVLLGWLLVDARTDVGRGDVAFVGALAALTAWITLSVLWSDAVSLTIDEAQRTFFVLASVSMVLVLARRATQVDIAFAAAIAIAALSAYGLATRLLPESFGTYDPVAGYRLAEPIGYWNGLGVLSAVGLLLAVGVATEPKASPWLRVPAASSSVVLVSALFFTYSRGGWLALGIGFIALMALTTRRLATFGALLILVPAPALAVVASSRATALTRQVRDVEAATADGRRLVVALAVLSVLAAIAAAGLVALERRITLSRRSRSLLGGVVVATALAAFTAGLVWIGDPVATVNRTVRQLNDPPLRDDVELNERLFSLSGNGRAMLWQVAWDAYRDQPVLGGGAGTFERRWQASPDASFKARDAHSLYLETLAELGPVGLALLLTALAIPVVAILASRRGAIVPAAAGAYVAFAVHAAVDWDWELPAVTVAGLLSGSAGLVACRGARLRRLPTTGRALAGVAIVAMSAGAGFLYVGHASAEHAELSLRSGRPAVALEHARRARAWAPWSPTSATLLGETLLQLGDRAAARSAFDDAIALDPGYWRAWLGRAVVSRGAAHAEALRRARDLYKNSREITASLELAEQASSPGNVTYRRTPTP